MMFNKKCKTCKRFFLTSNDSRKYCDDCKNGVKTCLECKKVLSKGYNGRVCEACLENARKKYF